MQEEGGDRIRVEKESASYARERGLSKGDETQAKKKKKKNANPGKDNEAGRHQSSSSLSPFVPRQSVMGEGGTEKERQTEIKGKINPAQYRFKVSRLTTSETSFNDDSNSYETFKSTWISLQLNLRNAVKLGNRRNKNLTMNKF